MRSRRPMLFIALLTGAFPGVAAAGMPSFGFSEVAHLRLQVISFFLAGLLLSAGFVQWLWNSLRTDFRWMPRLSFGRACGVVALWGLLFVVVLTMISGARELMTPGAWEKHGLTYRLAESGPSDASLVADSASRMERQRHLDRLGAALLQYARDHDGEFPESAEGDEIPPELWRTPDASGMRYRYLSSAGTKEPHDLLVVEPDIFEGNLLALRRDGRMDELTLDQIRRRQQLPAKVSP